MPPAENTAASETSGIPNAGWALAGHRWTSVQRKAKAVNDALTELYYGTPVGDGMKGYVLDGDIVSWDTNSDNGTPHHDDIDDIMARQLQLSNYSSLLEEISISGESPPLSHSSIILDLFSGYKNDTTIDADIGLIGTKVDFKFRGPVWKFKEFFSKNPPPDTEDYDNGENDVDFLWDYKLWTRLPHFKKSKTEREILGRGGRKDVWQEKDEDTSKSFSVYNNPPEKIHSVSDDQLDYLRSGMRDLSLFEEAFEGAADGGISATELANSGKYFGKIQPIILHVDHKDKIYLHDGRHRYTAARKYGAKSILATVVHYGPRGGVISKKTYIVGIK